MERQLKEIICTGENYTKLKKKKEEEEKKKNEVQ